MLQVSLLTENGNTKDDLRLPTDDNLLTQVSDLVFSLSDMLEQVFLFVWSLNLSIPLHLYLLRMQTKSTPCWNCVMIFLITMIWWCIANFISSHITPGYLYVFFLLVHWVVGCFRYDTFMFLQICFQFALWQQEDVAT